MSFDLTPAHLRDLARGAAFLGTGGGGDPYIGRLMVEQALAEGGRIEVVPLEELPDDAFVIPTAMMGAPTVMVEKIPAGFEAVQALRALERHLGRIATHTMPIECGGINSMMPLVVAARTGLPVVDGDGMGRAFPELQMETFGVYGVPGSPMVVAGEHGDTALVQAHDNERMEWMARGLCIRLGGASLIAEYSMDGATAKRTAVPATISLGISIGRWIREAREAHEDPFAALIEKLAGTPYSFARVIFEGKVVDVFRRTTEGFARGTARLETFDRDSTLDLAFQNEHLIARVDGEVRGIVPDLICVLDADTAEPITTEGMRYGQRAKVMVVATPPIMRTPEALAVFGPRCFGLDEDFTPVEEFPH